LGSHINSLKMLSFSFNICGSCNSVVRHVSIHLIVLISKNMHECDDNDIEIPSFWSVIENDSHKLWNIRTYMLNEILAKLSKVHHNSENLKPLIFLFKKEN
jgi:hypothetical protein